MTEPIILRKTLRHILLPVIFAVTVSSLFWSDNYMMISLLTAILSLFYFFSGIEKKKFTTRRLVITAVITALSAAGRFIPIFKPVTAFAIIAGAALGGEVGFTVGALSALISNIWFGQGPWTPFQMLAWGLIGYVAALLSRSLFRHRAWLYAYGAVAGVVFSMIMDVWSTLWYSGGFNLSLYLASVVTSLPHMTLYAVSNVVFLGVMFQPFCQKLDRIKIKYGI